MIQIAICDDSEVTLQHLNQSVNTILKSNQEAAAITLYSSSESLSYDIEEGHFFDLILTDIEMPHMNGRNDPDVSVWCTDHLHYCLHKICTGCL